MPQPFVEFYFSPSIAWFGDASVGPYAQRSIALGHLLARCHPRRRDWVAVVICRTRACSTTMIVLASALFCLRVCMGLPIIPLPRHWVRAPHLVLGPIQSRSLHPADHPHDPVLPTLSTARLPGHKPSALLGLHIQSPRPPPTPSRSAMCTAQVSMIPSPSGEGNHVSLPSAPQAWPRHPHRSRVS
ncbi:hypothetical protein BDY17DRAFT_42980 [Neohortaea acidophila]|uniref:Uncharacterized protein n=1 Tax=Neohortaea acidophila TaxID=245834 RepID=A0A6A6PIB1_9PEZI|nr:uncharacterized protein BDY17DRAFT_42980 [Neohortaea acidophila]KAF2479665.1 hypothetical protein BDY17DRAFT_42980 [Neohortaea acidophila]